MKRSKFTPQEIEAATEKARRAAEERYYGDYLRAIDDGANVHAVDEKDRCLFYWAVLGGEAKIVKDLLARGVDVQRTTKDGWTPMHQAVMMGPTDLVQILADAGAAISGCWHGSDGSHPIHWARGDLIPLLVSLGADINARDSKGRTPLHYWVGISSYFFEPVVARWIGPEVSLYLAAGADPSLLDNEGKTPLDLLPPGHRKDKRLMRALAPLVAEHQRRELEASTPAPPPKQGPMPGGRRL